MNASNTQLSVAQRQTSLGDGYLQFKLNHSTTAILLVQFTQEVVILPHDSITSVPNISELILGLMNWRNRIIWVVDLSRMFGFNSNISSVGQCNIIVVRHGVETIGLMVPEIKGTVRFNPEMIQDADNQVPLHIIPYLTGCICRNEELNLVLNIQSILQSLFVNNS